MFGFVTGAAIGGAAAPSAVAAQRRQGGAFVGVKPTTRTRFDAATPAAQKRCAPRMVFGLGAGEIAVVAGVALLIFGPSKLASSGKSLGSMAGSVKKATAEFQEAMQESLEEADKEIAARKAKEGSAEASKEGTTTAAASTEEKSKSS
ncbi:Sec-independent protein translocase protein TatA [Porphyridium purpureum]|uniref:Sec-independent protein translocase protein TatA n=1 Tax=Porphyridium purpureum TaxID=35688 RepID=A0A5J4YZZ5_PORPP|nr:Sec-independent protein translocase protein TatA [Porphyridium purpureum]|eukprot:POR5288..scf208_2